MHSVTPYLLKSFDRYNSDNKEQEYFTLSNFRNHDLLNMLYEFMNEKSGHAFIFEEDKKVYRFSDIRIDAKKRYISAFFTVGSYGVKQDIIDIKTNKISFPKKENDADILNHFVMFAVPSNCSEAIGLFHKSHGKGVKSLFDKLFKPYFLDKVKATLQITPYSHTETVSEWAANARVKELIVSGYVPSSDVAENIAQFGECNTEFKIKPKIKKRGLATTLGSLAEFMNPNLDSAHNQFITHSEEFGASVRVVAQLNDTKRTFYVGSNSRGVSCDILFGESEEDFGEDNVVEMDGGQPQLSSLRPWAIKLTNDILKGVYGKKAYQI